MTTTQDPTLTGVWDKIRKLLNLTVDRGATPAEAATAAAKVQALLDDHNLALEDAPTQPSDAAINAEDVVLTDSRRSPYNTAYSGLLYVLAKWNWCRAVYTRDGKSRLFGKKANIEVVRYLYVYLLRVLSNEAERTYRLHLAQRGAYAAKSLVTWKVSFLLGACAEINRRLECQRIIQQASGSRCNALLVVNDQLVEQRVREEFPRLETTTSRCRSVGGWQAGTAFARRVPLSPGLESRRGGRAVLR